MGVSFESAVHHSRPTAQFEQFAAFRPFQWDYPVFSEAHVSPGTDSKVNGKAHVSLGMDFEVDRKAHVSLRKDLEVDAGAHVSLRKGFEVDAGAHVSPEVTLAAFASIRARS